MLSRKVYGVGFSMIEVMVAIAVALVLMALAAPSFVPLIAGTRITSQTNDLVADIALARSESVTRGVRVTICMSLGGSTCDGASWKDGRIVFIDINGDGVRDAGSDTLLKVTEGLSGNTTLTSSGFPHAGYIQFRSYGGLNPATRGDFTLCSTSAPNGRKVSIEAFGTVTTTTSPCH